ncbi:MULTISPECIES: tetratricopeptide repeat protein [Chryseobacterium]|uniref:tetratricopeptide repeat protein n=1 Tax=Chryseobacterium TaxID=59732 RepID=UPI0031E1ACD1
MKKYLFSLLFGTLFSISAFACLNGEKMVLANQEILYVDLDGEVPYGHQIGGKEELEEFLVKLKKGYDKTKDVDYLSDEGYILILLGRYQEAIDLYRRIETLQPGRYSTASNIGTAYELIGNNKEALKWIETAVKIEPHSHLKSEWIHLNILKAKISGKSISSTDLIGKDFGNGKAPKSTLSKDDLQLLKMQIFYQLNERMTFVKPKDPIVAQLLFDLGNIALLMNQKYDAEKSYLQAKKYGLENPVLKERMKLSSQTLVKNKKRIPGNLKAAEEFNWISIMFSVLSLIISGFIIFKFRKKIFSWFE